MTRATEDQSRRKIGTKHRSRTVVLTATVILLAILWIIYWYGASQIGAAVLDRAAAAAAARGYAATCDDISGGGFPLSVDLSCSRATLAATGGTEAVIEGFAATTALYKPWSLRSTAAGPLTVSRRSDDFGMTASWKKAETTIDAGLGGLSGIATRLEGLDLDLTPDGAISFDSVTLTRGEFAVAPATDDTYRFSVAARDVVLGTERGSDLPGIDLDADLSAVDFGGSLGLDPRQAARSWIASGGNMRIDDLDIAADAFSAQAEGTLTLSAAGKLSGDLEVTITGLESLPDLINPLYPDASDQTEQIVAAVVAFTRQVDTPSGPARQMTLLLRDSVVSIGILPIGVVTPITF